MAPPRLEPKETVVSLAVLADYFGITPRAVGQMAMDGILPRLDHSKYPLKDCIRAYIHHIKKRHEKMKVAYEASLTDERARLTKAKADEAELKFQERSGSLIPVEAIEAAWTGVGSMIKMRLLAIPSKLAPRLVTMKKAPDIQRAIDREITDVLNELAKAKVNATEDADGDPDQD